MDKEIIIDGVDVSECKYNEKESCYIYACSCDADDFCTGNKNCYYKQLKRLQHYQAEFEHELMNDYTYDGYISPNGFTPIDVIKHIKSELQRLEQENERLKSAFAIWENATLKQTALKVVEVDKYRQALQEIKDIADRTDGNHPASVINMVSVIRHTINSVIGAEE